MPNAVSEHSAAPVHERLRAILQKYWGFDTLRPLQREAIDAAVARRDSLVILPTGGGKSLCYQVPPMLVPEGKPALCVVVSPLIALMKDQVDGLVMAGYPAAALNSTTTNADAADIRRRALSGELKLLLVAPERLLTESFLSFLVKANVASIAIDEAHCISQWGHDFRPEYRRLAELRSVFPNVPLHAYTATATPRVRDDIVAQLGLKNPALLTGRFDRPNLTYRILPRVDTDRQVAEVLRRRDGGTGGGAAIVYCMSRKETERLAASLTAQKIPAAAYHAGMDPKKRHDVQEDFANERLDVVVATVAFGMGIDRSDVRCVVHATMPKTIEHYQQETGRAGRDGLPSECVLLYSSADAVRWKGLMEKSAAESDSPPDPEAMAAQIELLEHMQRLCSGARCRHKALSEYFGQAYEPPAAEKAGPRRSAEDAQGSAEEKEGERPEHAGGGNCRHESSSSSSSSPRTSASPPLTSAGGCSACDVCLQELDTVPDSTIVAQKIVSCVARLSFMGADGSPRGYGAGYVADVLRGSRAAKIIDRAHDKLSTFGLLAQMPREEIVSLISQLVDAHMLARAGTEFPTVITGPAARALLKGEQQATLLRPRAGEETGVHAGAYTADGAKARALSHQEHALFDTLRSLRRAIATEMSVPPFVVFSDAVLEDLCRVRPSSVAAFGTVRGIGQSKQTKFGERFVQAIVNHCRASGLDLDATPPPSATAPAYSPRTRSVKSLPAGDPNRPLYSLTESVRTAFEMFEKGATVDEVATHTRRAVSTVGGYLAEFIQRYKPETVRAWVDDATYRLISETSDGIPLTEENSTQHGLRIGAVYQALVAKQPDERALATYEQIRVVVTHRAALASRAT